MNKLSQYNWNNMSQYINQPINCENTMKMQLIIILLSFLVWPPHVSANHMSLAAFSKLNKCYALDGY